LIDALLQPSALDRPGNAGDVAAILAPFAGLEASLNPPPIPLVQSDRTTPQFPSVLSLTAPRVHNDLGIAELSDPHFPPSSKLRFDAESWGLPPGAPLPLDSEIRARRAPTTAPRSGHDDALSPVDLSEEPLVAPSAPSRSSTAFAVATAAAAGFSAGLLTMLAAGLF
jgi:hypothetical protein